jgi:hypothetical protein
VTFTALKNHYAIVTRIRELTEELYRKECGYEPGLPISPEYVEPRVQTFIAAGVSPEELEEAIRDYEK